MDAITSPGAADESRTIEFTGTMREYIPIATTNALLTLVTLFVYRSWAKARSRRYLWSHTRFIDDQLQWTGTGMEMFVGFIAVAILFGIGALIVNFGLPALFLRAGPIAGLIAVPLLYLTGMFLYGLARFRGLRYRLSRTWWRGIRGGSDDGGWTYGRKAIGYYLASFVAAGLFYPWAQAKLWNERWNRMSFGSDSFDATMSSDDTRGAFFVLWGTIVVGSFVIGGIMAATHGSPVAMLFYMLFYILFYAGIGLAYLGFLTAYYQSAADFTRIGDIEFRFDATYSDWLKFFATTLGLAIVTLGLATLVYDFRKWRFVTQHLTAFGTVDVDLLTQSQTHAPREAEGILDALDIGAF